MVTKGIRVGLLVASLLVLGFSFSDVWQAAAASEEEQSDVIKIEILMGEYFYQVEGQALNAPIELEIGKRYELEFKNVGVIVHEVMIGTGVLTNPEGMMHGYKTNLFQGVEVMIKGEMNGKEFEVEVDGLMEIELQPGQQLGIEFALPFWKVGRWEVGCFVVDSDGKNHYDKGMKAPLIVK